MRTIPRTAIDLILSAVHNHVGDDGLMSTFVFSSQPGSPASGGGLGTTIFFSLRGMTTAALFVRRNGPAYLQVLSVEDIRTMLQDFLIKHFSYVASETLFRKFFDSYTVRVSESSKNALAQALAESNIFSPRNSLTLFPLVTLDVEYDFGSTPFFFRQSATLLEEIPPEHRIDLVVDRFPPLSRERMRTESTNAWLGISSPLLQTSRKMKSAILGAMALSLPRQHRYMFTGRRTFGGYCTISDGVSFAFGDAHMPPIFQNLLVRACDQEWLHILADKLVSSDQTDRRQIRALEYFYRSWSLDASERFPVMCMALDAVYSDATEATKSVIDGIRTTLGSHIEETRLRMLMQIRASVIHGGAPDVYDSRKYRKYYQMYLTDPINDLDDVLVESLRQRVFGKTFKLQGGMDADVISKLQEQGRLPRNIYGRGILGEVNSDSHNDV